MSIFSPEVNSDNTLPADEGHSEGGGGGGDEERGAAIDHSLQYSYYVTEFASKYRYWLVFFSIFDSMDWLVSSHWSVQVNLLC